MIGIFYNISISLYGLLVRIASLFNPKAKLWIEGRRNLFSKLEKAGSENGNVIWIHCASLGEFEQGRPIIESLRKEHPQKKILLTFFSPSGFEVRKNYEYADWVLYMPLDTRANAKRFMSIVKPELAIFVKYEFWANHFRALDNANIPIIMVSAIFRPEQRFFKASGRWFRKTLNVVEHFFVQNEESVSLLHSIGMKNVTKTGDTRFDRVKTIVSQAESIPLVEKFKDEKPIIILGSSWAHEEQMMADFYKKMNQDTKIIIAPHETDFSNCERIVELYGENAGLYSSSNLDDVQRLNVLVIDNQGMLSSLYMYADIAIIGGGFGKGIHNILEAATFGMPLLFGPNYKKFQEAKDLIKLQAATSFSDNYQMESLINKLLLDEKNLNEKSRIAKDYVLENTGATKTILNYLEDIL